MQEVPSIGDICGIKLIASVTSRTGDRSCCSGAAQGSLLDSSWYQQAKVSIGSPVPLASWVSAMWCFVRGKGLVGRVLVTVSMHVTFDKVARADRQVHSFDGQSLQMWYQLVPRRYSTFGT